MGVVKRRPKKDNEGNDYTLAEITNRARGHETNVALGPSCPKMEECLTVGIHTKPGEKILRDENLGEAASDDKNVIAEALAIRTGNRLVP